MMIEIKKLFSTIIIDLIQVADCVTINNITVTIESSKCFKNIPVSFYKFGEKKSGFLSNNGIIAKTSRIRDCKSSRIITLSRSIHYLVMVDKTVSIRNVRNKLHGIRHQITYHYISITLTLFI